LSKKKKKENDEDEKRINMIKVLRFESEEHKE